MAILETLLVRLGVDMSEAEDGLDEGSRRINRTLTGMAAGAGIAGAGLGLAFSMGIESAMDIASAQTSLETQLGLTEAQAQRAGDVAGDVFSRGFGESMADVTDALGGVHSSIGNLGDFTDGELEQMSASALGLAKAFKVDVADATGAVGKLIKTGLVADATEGFDLIAKTMEGIPAELRDDVLPTMEEYSTQFRRVGLDGQTSMGLISQALNNGARDADQVADAIGQFGERALAGGTAVDEAYDSIGLSADDMAAKIGRGGADAEEALRMTLEALRGTENEQTKLNAAAALFGDPANVMGDALFALDPASAAASAGLDNAKGSMQTLTDAMEGDPAQQFDAVMRTVQNTLGQLLLPVLIRVGEFLRENQGLIKALLIPALIALAAIFVILTAATIAWTVALLANPIVWIISLIVLLVAAVVLLVVKWDWVKARLLAQWELIKAGLKAGWDWLVANVFEPIGRFFTQTIPRWAGMLKDKAVTAFVGMRDGVSDAVTTAVRWVRDKWNGLVDFVTGLPGRIGRAASGMWDGIKSSFRSAVNFLIAGWNNLSFTIGGGSVLGIDIPSLTLSTPNIPFLAEGGIVTGPTLAMIGEGGDDEVVAPLSKLDQMINTASAPSVGKVKPAVTRVVFDVTGADEDMKRLISRIIAVDGEGDPDLAFT